MKKKLELKKEVVSQLVPGEMLRIQGGWERTVDPSCEQICPQTQIYTCVECPSALTNCGTGTGGDGTDNLACYTPGEPGTQPITNETGRTICWFEPSWDVCGTRNTGC